MKKTLHLTLPILLLSGHTATAAVVFSDNFTYPDGNLVGNGGWLQNGTALTSGNNPIQVSSGTVGLPALTAGQDTYNNFSAAIPNADGTFAYYSASVTVTSASSGGDYFLHFTNGVANPTSLSGRLAAQSTAGGFFLGYSESSAAGSNYGTTLLTLNTAYNVIVRYGFVAGTVNDTAAIFVSAGVFNPVESLNTPYLTDVYNGATGEIGSFTGIAIRQGAATTAAGVVIDNLVVGNNFVDVIPEPSAALLGSLAGLSLLRRGR